MRTNVTRQAYTPLQSNLPKYIFGLHGSGGEACMLAAYKPGWIVVNVQVNPPDSTGDFSALADNGLGVIVCLNNGYGSDGTLPRSSGYDAFTQQCAAFVENSKGVHLWIIGNEPNTIVARPGNDGLPNSGEVITPTRYARCFNQCRRAIRALPEHTHDWVIPAAIAPFDTQTKYAPNVSGDWVRYFADVLLQITAQQGMPDALALHTFTHGYNARLVTSDARAFANRMHHWHLRAYRDYLAVVPPMMRTLPVLITEVRPLDTGWMDQPRGWIQSVCAEINTWNATAANQPIQAVCFSRWQTSPGDPPEWAMSDKPSVIEDFNAALQNDYRARWHDEPSVPDYCAEWLAVPEVLNSPLTINETIVGQVRIKNTGAKTWRVEGDEALCVGCYWYDVADRQFALPRDVLPGQIVVIDQINLCAPAKSGTHILHFALIKEGKPLRTAAFEQSIVTKSPTYVAEWIQPFTIKDNLVACDAQFVGTVRVKNTGAGIWTRRAVRLTYGMYDVQGEVTSYVGQFGMSNDTYPGEIAEFDNVILQTPSSEGIFTLRWDLLEEDRISFSAQGVSPCEQYLTVRAEYSAKWIQVFDIPAALEPNEPIGGSVVVRNVGLQIWNAASDLPNWLVPDESPVVLVCRWCDAASHVVQTARFTLTHDVPRDANATFANIVLATPVAQGEYALTFELEKKGAQWASRPYAVDVRVQTDAPDFCAEWIETPAITRALIAGDKLHGRVVVKNNGAQMWPDNVCLHYRWYDAAGQEIGVSSSFLLAQSVLPRDLADFESVSVCVPDVPGEHLLKWDLLHDESQRFADDGSPTADIAVTVRPVPPDWCAEFIAHDISPSLVVGEAVIANVRVKNAGKNIWQNTGVSRVTMGYRWRDALGQLEGENHSTELTTEVLSEILNPLTCFAETQVMLNAPQKAGASRLELDFFAEGVGWFSENGGAVLSLPIQVTSAPAPTHLWRVSAQPNAISAVLTIDGNFASCWSSGAPQSLGMWFRVDLNMPRVIDGIAFRSPGLGHPFGYALRISRDGENWLTLAKVASGNTRDIFATFAPCEVLYVQVDLDAVHTEEWMISEILIHPHETWKATASVNTELAKNAIDNNPVTGWTTAPNLQSPNMWFQVDFGRVEIINGLNLIAPDDESPRALCVSVWNEQGGCWYKIIEYRDLRAPIERIEFAPVQTRYVQIQLLSESEQPWTIDELQVIRTMTDWIGPIRIT